MFKKLIATAAAYAVALMVVVPVLAQNVDTIQMHQNGLLTQAYRAMQRGDMERAIDLSEQALTTNLSDAQTVIAHNNLCVGLHMQGDLENGASHCTLALDVNPGYWRAYNNRANIFFDQERFADAEADYRRALQLNPGSDTVRKNLGLVRQLVVSN
jgi:tetratricopeptide (TPR) repeat protein